jgi:hypothetical protein
MGAAECSEPVTTGGKIQAIAYRLALLLRIGGYRAESNKLLCQGDVDGGRFAVAKAARLTSMVKVMCI